MANPLRAGWLGRLAARPTIAVHLRALGCGVAFCLAASQPAISEELISIPVGTNTELEDASSAPGGAGFSISIDGDHIAGDQPVVSVAGTAPKAVAQRQTDLALEEVDIRITFDGLDVVPRLSVATQDLRASYRAGDTVRFNTSTNYPDWIDRAEILVFAKGDGGSKPVSVVDVVPGDSADWTMPAGGADEYEYVLRVYDEKGRFDETSAMTLLRTSRDMVSHETTGSVIAAGYGDNMRSVRNIPVHGGAVTVSGNSVPQGHSVTVLGSPVPIDGSDSFVYQRILPAGDHLVDVAVSGQGGDQQSLYFERDINIPRNDFFYVGLADLTIGKRFGSGAVVAATPGEYDGVYAKGRLAFYLKGKIRGDYLLTAAADTGEDNIETLFRGLDAKNARAVLNRIDPDDYYPVYGDDSSAIEDAPTSGKFYIRLEKGDSRVLWGNFKQKIDGAKLLRSNRALYGAQAVLRSEDTTSFGARRYEATAYAAQPGTLPQRELLRATGGSAYFLKRQDITRGSETVEIVVKDRVTGRVIGRETLVAGKDYQLDAAQGVLILTSPLSSHAGATGVVRGSTFGDGVVSLSVTYEYTPTSGQLDGYSYGGRAQAWVTDNVRIGATAMSEETGIADQRMVGADIVVRHSEETYVHAEYAQTRGPGFGFSRSTDGGLTNTDIADAGSASRTGTAVTVEGQLDLADLPGDLKGKLRAHYAKKTAGFSTLDDNITVDQTTWGVSGEVEVTDNTTLSARHENFADADGKVEQETTVSAKVDLNDAWSVEAGIGHVKKASPTAPANETGERVDAGFRITYAPDEDTEVYAFGQATVSQSGGLRRIDRYGVGGSKQISEKLTLEGEVSGGTTGLGATAAIAYTPTPDDKYHIGYTLDPERSLKEKSFDGRDLGGVVFGASHRYNDMISAQSETTYDMFGKRRSLTSTYGVTLTPDNKWTLTGGYETGRVSDPDASDFDLHAVSASASYVDGEKLSVRARAEARFESSEDGTRDRQTYMLLGGVLIKMSEDWRLSANLDAVISSSDQSSLLDGDYVEASVGFAYRPVDNEKLNALFRYSYLYDLPGPDQVTASGSSMGPAQRSHVLSVDVTYDINQYLTLGAKYGFRIGEISATRAANDFVPASAHLGIVRADLHVVHNWDLLLEGRVLALPEAGQTYYGALAAIYRHIGNNLKIGVGYNFGQFSDDITDLTYDDQGVFVNVVGKF